MQTDSCLFVSLWAALLLFSGVTLNTLLGRKGSLEKMKDYWDVGFYLGANILTNEHKKVIEASEKLYRLKPPIWWDSWLIITQILIITPLFADLIESNKSTVCVLSGLWRPLWRRSSCTDSLPNYPRWNLPNRTRWTSGWSCSCRPTNLPSPQTAAQ